MLMDASTLLSSQLNFLLYLLKGHCKPHKHCERQNLNFHIVLEFIYFQAWLSKCSSNNLIFTWLEFFSKLQNCNFCDTFKIASRKLKIHHFWTFSIKFLLVWAQEQHQLHHEVCHYYLQFIFKISYCFKHICSYYNSFKEISLKNHIKFNLMFSIMKTEIKF